MSRNAICTLTPFVIKVGIAPGDLKFRATYRTLRLSCCPAQTFLFTVPCNEIALFVTSF